MSQTVRILDQTMTAAPENKEISSEQLDSLKTVKKSFLLTFPHVTSKNKQSEPKQSFYYIGPLKKAYKKLSLVDHFPTHDNISTTNLYPSPTQFAVQISESKY